MSDTNTKITKACYSHLGQNIVDCMHLIERYSKASSRQYQRFIEALPDENINPTHIMKADEAYSISLVELHFYLITIAKVYRCAHIISEALGGPIKAYFEDNKKWFAEYREARNQFEHLLDRAHGDKRNSPMPVAGDEENERTIYLAIKGGLDDLSLKYRDEEIDISKTSHDKFINFVYEFCHLVDDHSREKEQ